MEKKWRQCFQPVYAPAEQPSFPLPIIAISKYQFSILLRARKTGWNHHRHQRPICPNFHTKKTSNNLLDLILYTYTLMHVKSKSVTMENSDVSIGSRLEQHFYSRF